MIKKTITYVDYNNEKRTENFYFNFSVAELSEMELEHEGGLSTTIKKIIDAKNVPSIVKIFKDLLLKAYGEKSNDGRRFIKSEELSTEFSQTEAYSILFMELATDPEKAAAFFEGVVPQTDQTMPNENKVKVVDDIQQRVIEDYKNNNE